jgi:hypothetical protein
MTADQSRRQVPKLAKHPRQLHVSYGDGPERFEDRRWRRFGFNDDHIPKRCVAGERIKCRRTRNTTEWARAQALSRER